MTSLASHVPANCCWSGEKGGTPRSLINARSMASGKAGQIKVRAGHFEMFKLPVLHSVLLMRPAKSPACARAVFPADRRTSHAGEGRANMEINTI